MKQRSYQIQIFLNFLVLVICGVMAFLTNDFLTLKFCGAVLLLGAINMMRLISEKQLDAKDENFLSKLKALKVDKEDK